MTVELGFDNGFYLGQSVKPFENGRGLLVIAKASVDLLANLVREAGDFSGAHMRVEG